MASKNNELNLSYEYLVSLANLTLAWRKAKKGKTRRQDVINFERNLERNLLELHIELKNKTYFPMPLEDFIISDPKTRKISKSDFRDRVVHRAIIIVIQNLFEKSFIYDSCANQKKKGNLFAIKRFDIFFKKVSKNYNSPAFCLKADIKKYFENIDHETLLKILEKKISDLDILDLIKKILTNTPNRIKPNFSFQRERE